MRGDCSDGAPRAKVSTDKPSDANEALGSDAGVRVTPVSIEIAAVTVADRAALAEMPPSPVVGTPALEESRRGRHVPPPFDPASLIDGQW
jgi:hypothetical protein